MNKTTIDSELFSELKKYILSIQDISLRIKNLESRFGEIGNTASTIIFHISESTRFWIGGVILKEDVQRNRDSEFENSYSLDSLNQSLNSALEYVEKASNTKINLSDSVDLKGLNTSTDLQYWNVAKSIIHATAHAAHHFSQLKAIEEWGKLT